MTESNLTPEAAQTADTAAATAPAAATAAAELPVLTLDPSSMAKDKAVLDEAVASLEKAQQSAPQAVASTLKDMDTSMLSEDDKKAIQAFVSKIDIENPDHVLLFGADAQKKVSDFSDSALASVRTNDTGEVGNMLVKLINEIKGFSDDAEAPTGIRKLFWNAKKAVSDLTTKYEKVEVNVDSIATSLENHQVQLLKDVSMFNHLYDMNTQYFKELTMYIVAGEQKLNEARSTTLQELKTKATQSGDAMDAQRANDYDYVFVMFVL